MSIRKITCYVVDCDTCRLQFDQAGEDYVVHFDSANDAISYAAENGWIIAENGGLSCPRCWAIELCDRLGHLWGPWIPFACEGVITRHAAHGCGLVRHCGQCDHYEDCALADLPTIDEPTTSGR